MWGRLPEKNRISEQITQIVNIYELDITVTLNTAVLNFIRINKKSRQLQIGVAHDGFRTFGQEFIYKLRCNK